MTIEKTHKCKEDRRHAVMLEIPERVYEAFQIKLKKARVKSHETIMLTIPKGVPLRQYDPTLIRA